MSYLLTLWNFLSWFLAPSYNWTIHTYKVYTIFSLQYFSPFLFQCKNNRYPFWVVRWHHIWQLTDTLCIFGCCDGFEAVVRLFLYCFRRNVRQCIGRYTWNIHINRVRVDLQPKLTCLFNWNVLKKKKTKQNEKCEEKLRREMQLNTHDLRLRSGFSHSMPMDEPWIISLTVRSQRLKLNIFFTEMWIFFSFKYFYCII